MLHDRFDFCALRAVHHWCVKHLTDFDPKLLQFFGSVFCFAGEEALLFHHGAEKCDRAFFVSRLRLILGFFHLLFDRFFALLHFAVDELFHLIDFQKAFVVLRFADGGAFVRRENGHWQFFARDKLLHLGGLRVRNDHAYALRGIKGKGTRIAQAGILELIHGGGEPIEDQAASWRSIFGVNDLPGHLIDLFVATRSAAAHPARSAAPTSAASRRARERQ